MARLSLGANPNALDELSQDGQEGPRNQTWMSDVVATFLVEPSALMEKPKAHVLPRFRQRRHPYSY